MDACSPIGRVFLLIFLFHQLLFTDAYDAIYPGVKTYTSGDQAEIQVFENVTVGSVVLKDIREYLHISQERQVQLGPGELNSFFQLNPDYTLTVLKSLDLESGELCHAVKSCCRAEGQIQTGTAFFSQNDGAYNQIGYNQFFTKGPQCRLSAVVLANDGGPTSLKPVSRISVVIKDVNDNAPHFAHVDLDVDAVRSEFSHGPGMDCLHITFPEGMEGIGQSFALPTAVDDDFLPENSAITYSIAIKSPESDSFHEPGTLRKVELPIDTSRSTPTWVAVGPFRLVYQAKDSSLALEVARELDREAQTEYELILYAADNGGKQNTICLHVHVLDLNEFSPTFVSVTQVGNVEVTDMLDQGSGWRMIQIYENISVPSTLVQVVAEDKDAPPANKIIYKLGPGFPPSEVLTTFSLEPLSGRLTLERSLDYERTKRYKLSVLAIDANCDSTLESDNLTKRLLKKTVRAITESIKKERKTATLTLDIRVKDCNDNAPEIKLQGTVSDGQARPNGDIETVEVLENSPQGMSLVFFSATDRDQDGTGLTMCHLLNWTLKFRIHKFADFYSLETAGELDREQKSEYVLTIECSDSGNPSLVSQKSIRVVILDENDEAPQFNQPIYAFHVAEGSPPGTLLLTVGENQPMPVTAFDRDMNNSLIYHIEPSSTPSPRFELDNSDMGDQSIDYQLFDVEASSGQLSTKGVLDREQRKSHQFSLCASDGQHKTCAEVIVHLDDANDNPPMFERETYIIRLTENEQIFDPLIIFNVTDVDIGNQGFTFAIEPFQTSGVSSSESDSAAAAASIFSSEVRTLHRHFSIRDNKLFLRQPLDREKRAHFHFMVRVTDSQKVMSNGLVQSKNLSSTAEIFVEVADTNDNAPVFIFPNSSASSEGGNQLNVSCRETMGSSIGHIEATDADLGKNGTIVYSVIQGPVSNELFYLDKQSGELFVNSGSLIDNCDSVFLLVVSADDLGPPQSKKGRLLPVERLLIRLQNQPTLAEYMSLSSRQQVSDQDGLDSTRGDGGYFGMPAKTMLSVVLGGCIVFLTGLFLAWLILMIYNRSKRRRRERLDMEFQAQRCLDAAASHSESFLHPLANYPPQVGLQTQGPVLQYAVSLKDYSPSRKGNPASVSPRASPCGESINTDPGKVGTNNFQKTAAPKTSGSMFQLVTVSDERNNGPSPLHKTGTIPLNESSMAPTVSASWQLGGVNTFKASCGDKVPTNLVMLDKKGQISPAESVESMRYLLFPGVSSSTVVTSTIGGASGVPVVEGKQKKGTLTKSPHKQAKSKGADAFSPAPAKRSDRQRAKDTANESKESRQLKRQSQHMAKHYIILDPNQGTLVRPSGNPVRPFLTPPPKRKGNSPANACRSTPKKDCESTDVLENRHFLPPECEYTALLRNAKRSDLFQSTLPGPPPQGPNQYFIITSASSACNFQPGETPPRGPAPLNTTLQGFTEQHLQQQQPSVGTFSLPRQIRECSKSPSSSASQSAGLETPPPARRQVVLTKISGEEGVLVFPDARAEELPVTSSSSGLNNTLARTPGGHGIAPTEEGSLPIVNNEFGFETSEGTPCTRTALGVPQRICVEDDSDLPRFVNPRSAASPLFQTDYISLEDLMNNCV
ncbi:hypothetical protein SprV_0100208600 [Sparganum proliferum]